MIDKIILIVFLISKCYSVCPPSNITNPCTCQESLREDQEDDLTCGGDQYYNVTEISVRMSEWFANDTKEFEYLYFLNSNITSLEENSFYDISFKTIIIEADKIERIHENAFNSSRLSLLSFYISNAPMPENHPSPYNIYNLANSMINLNTLGISGKINSLPEKTLNGQNLLYITTYSFNRINNFAYYLLKNIDRIVLKGSFDFIPSNAFVVDDHNPMRYLSILIARSQLKGSNFELDVFTNPKRTLKLKLYANSELTYLNESVFKPLFDDYPESTIRLTFNSLDCNDCNLKWIIERKDYIEKLIGAECSNKQSFYNLTIHNFNHCTNICNFGGEYDGQYGITHWSPVGLEEVSEGKCNYGNGSARWMCLQNVMFDPNGPDFSECWLDSAIIDIQNMTDISNVTQIIENLIQNTESDASLSTVKELLEVIILINQLQNFVESSIEEIDLNIAFVITVNYTTLFSNLINQNNAWNNATDSQKTGIASEILLYIQKTSFTLSCKQNTTNDSIVITKRDISVETFHTNFSKEMIFEANDSSIIIPEQIDLKPNYICSYSAVGALIKKLDNYLLSGVEDEQQINTNIIAFSITNSNETIEINDGKKIRMSLKHKNRLESGDKIICVFWDFKLDEWSSNGCDLVIRDSNYEYSVCECNHLTNFAAILDMSERENNDSIKSLLIYMIVSILVIFFAIITITYYLKRKSKRRTDENSVKIQHSSHNQQISDQNENIQFTENIENDTHNVYSYDDLPSSDSTIHTKYCVTDKKIASLTAERLLIGRSDLVLDSVIGRGNFGCIYKASLWSSAKTIKQEVAVKTLNSRSTLNDNDIESFLAKELIMKNFKHQNVLTIIGVCFEKDGLPIIVLPFMKNGDLLSFMRDDKNMPTVRQLLGFAIEIARGMDYLANQKFVHRDLAARNCVLDENLSVKVADFGLSRDIYEREYYRSGKNMKLPLRWMSPESIEKGVYNLKTDVWSYGVLVWELFTFGDIPYPEVNNWQILYYLKQGNRLSRPLLCPLLLYSILLKCWSFDPNSRPCFKSVCDRVQVVIDQLEKKFQKDKVGLYATYADNSIIKNFCSHTQTNTELINKKKDVNEVSTC